MTDPYYQDDFVTLYHGDALDVMAGLEPGSVGSVVTDPPYCSGGRQQAGARNTISKSNSTHDDDWLPTDTMGSDSYLWWMREVGQRSMRIAESGAHAYVFTDWRQYPSIVTAWETTSWTLRSCLVWSKNRGGAMGSFWRNDHEWIAVFAKGKPAPLPNGGFFNVLTATKPQGGKHPTEKPLSVMSRIVEAAPGVILDPFAGSGSTLVAAKALGRKAIGVELDERYCEIAARRLSQGVLDFGAPA